MTGRERTLVEYRAAMEANPNASFYVPGRPDWAYEDANGKLLRGPCGDIDCRYMSDSGGELHAGPHSWEDGTTGWPHDYGRVCKCPDCD